MTAERRGADPNGSATPHDPHHDGDLEEPVDLSALAEDEETAAPFVGRLRRSVHRRLLGSNVVEFCVLGPAVVLLELVVAVAAVFTGDTEGGES